MKLERTGSIWDRLNRNNINYNWETIEAILKEFDGKRLLEESYNIFNKDNVGIGSISSVDGSVQDNNYPSTGFINLKPSTNYVMTSHGSGAFYDANGNFLSGINSSLTSFRTASNVYSMRVTLGSANPPESFMVHEGTALKPYVEFGFKPVPLIIAPELRAEISEAIEYFSDLDSLTLNRGKDFPLKSVKLGTQEPVEIAEHVKNVILDAKVSGAKPDMFYRITFIANGHVSNGKTLYGISLGEHRKSDGFRVRWVFTYNDANTPENQQNYNIEKGSDGIDTITAVRDDIVVSVTVDRAAITASANPTFLNLNSGIGNSPSAIINPSTYSAF